MSGPGRRPAARRRASMTLEAFEAFLESGQAGITIRGPFRIQPCRCGDVNCHGWRLVPDRVHGRRRQS
jgi:hypothetical protein